MSLIIPANIMTFFGGIWGKVALYGLMALALAYGFRLWLNKHDDKVHASAMADTKKQLEVQYVSQWQKALTEAKTMSDDAKVKYEAADALNRRIDMKFATIFTSLTQIRAAVEDRKVIYVKEAGAVPPAELDDALRILSNHIASQAPHR